MSVNRAPGERGLAGPSHFFPSLTQDDELWE